MTLSDNTMEAEGEQLLSKDLLKESANSGKTFGSKSIETSIKSGRNGGRNW